MGDSGRITDVPGRAGEIARAKNAMQRKLNRQKQKEKKEQALAALSDEAVKDKLKLTETDLETLQEIISNPRRNAMAQLAAIKLKAMLTVAPPKQDIGVEGVTVTVNTLTYPAATTTTTTVTTKEE